MVCLYWIFIAGALLGFVALVRGTIRDVRNGRTKNNTRLDDGIKERLDKIIELLEKKYG